MKNLHVIAENISIYGNLLHKEEKKLRSLRSKDSDMLLNTIKELSSNLQFISLWVSSGNADIEMRIEQCLKLTKILNEKSYSANLLSDSKITYNEMADKINSIFDEYAESTSSKNNLKIIKESEIALEKFSQKANQFWKNQSLQNNLPKQPDKKITILNTNSKTLNTPSLLKVKH